MLIFGFICGFFLGGTCAVKSYIDEDFVTCMRLFVENFLSDIGWW